MIRPNLPSPENSLKARFSTLATLLGRVTVVAIIEMCRAQRRKIRWTFQRNFIFSTSPATPLVKTKPLGSPQKSFHLSHYLTNTESDRVFAALRGDLSESSALLLSSSIEGSIFVKVTRFPFSSQARNSPCNKLSAHSPEDFLIPLACHQVHLLDYFSC